MLSLFAKHLLWAWKDNNYRTIKHRRDYKNVESFLLPPQIVGYPIVRIKAFEATFMSTNEFDFSQEFFGITAIARKDKTGIWNVDNDGIIKLNMFPKKVKNTFFAMIEERIELKNTILLTFEYNPRQRLKLFFTVKYFLNNKAWKYRRTRWRSLQLDVSSRIPRGFQLYVVQRRS